LVVARITPLDPEVFSPPAKQLAFDGQEMLRSSWVLPEGTVWALQVVPELVVARISPPLELLIPVA
jgi:hypothetical protein